MKRFIKKTLIFLSIVFIVGSLLDILFTYRIKKTHLCEGEIEVWNDIYNADMDVQVLIHGSSRAVAHINPKIIKDSLHLSAYNLGLVGHNFWIQHLRHIEYLKHNKKPDIIIVAVDHMTLYKREDLFYLQQFLPYMFWNKDMYEYTKSYKGYEAFDYFIPLMRYRGKSHTIKELSFINRSTNHRNLGFIANPNKKFDPKREYKTYKLDDSSIKLFESFIDDCKKNEIQLILTYTPEYIEGQSCILNREEISRYFHFIAQRENLLFLDYSNHEISHQMEYFIDNVHLNGEGANIFTKQLVNDIKSSGLLTPAPRP